MRKYLKFIFLFTWLLANLAGCRQNTEGQNIEGHYDETVNPPVNAEAVDSIETLNLIALKNHEKYYQGADNSFSFLAPDDFDPLEDQRIARQIQADNLTGFRQYYMPSEIFMTVEEAKADVDFLFGFLKNSYPGYYAYGGSDKFVPLQEHIKEALNAFEDTAVTPFDLNALLQSTLYPVAPDYHFLIDGLGHEPLAIAYWIESLDFLKDTSGYFIKNQNTAPQYLERISLESGQAIDIENAMALSLNKEGEVIYRVSVMDSIGMEPQAVLDFSGGQQETFKFAPVNEYIGGYPQMPDKLWDLTDIDGIPLLSIHSFSAWEPEHFKSLEALADSGETLKGAPFLLIDLRGNSGGMAQYAVQWLANFFELEDGDELPFHRVGSLATLVSETTLATYNEYWGDYDEWLETFSYNEKKANNNLPSWQYHTTAPLTQALDNEGFIFVLMDRTSLSAAEYFVNYLSMVDRVILVGDYTGGAFNFGSTRNLFLPNSGAGIQCSTNLFMQHSGNMVDGTGFAPDLLCASEDSLSSVIQYIRRQQEILN